MLNAGADRRGRLARIAGERITVTPYHRRIFTLAVLLPRQRGRGQVVADMKECCETADVTKYESFWLAIAAAAPVIALAVVVVLPDTSGVTGDVFQPIIDDWFDSPEKFRAALKAAGAGGPVLEAMSDIDLTGAKADAKAKARSTTLGIRGIAAAIRWIAIGNVMVQAVLLALSLVALAYNVDVISRWLAIVLTVGGILLLAATVVMVSDFNTMAAGLPKMMEKLMTNQMEELLKTEPFKELQAASESAQAPKAHGRLAAAIRRLHRGRLGRS